MASTSAPSTAGGRAVTQVQHELLARCWSGDGVLGSPDDSSLVFADTTGRQVKFRASKTAVVGGHGYFSGATDIAVPVTANTSGSTRIDLAVLRLDRSTWEVTEAVVAGSPGAGVPPAATQNSYSVGTGVWELPVATVTVVNGAATLGPADAVPIEPHIAGGPLCVTTVAALNLIPSPTPGRLVWVHAVKQMYVYLAGTGWQRADWNTAWGVVGGHRHSAGGSSFGDGITTELALGMNSGAVALTAGRRYSINVLVHVVRSSTGAVEMRIRDTSVSGTKRGYLHTSSLNAVEGYTLPVSGRYDCTASETKTFVLTGNVLGSGSANFTRSPEVVTYFEVVDMGPTGILVLDP